jgi:hypothetical protein
MPCFFFHVRTVQDLFVDLDGSELPNLCAACEEALLAFRYITAERLRGGNKILDLQPNEIADDVVRTLTSVPLNDPLSTMH